MERIHGIIYRKGLFIFLCDMIYCNIVSPHHTCVKMTSSKAVLCATAKITYCLQEYDDGEEMIDIILWNCVLQVTEMASSKEIKEEYTSSLADLTFNSKPLISVLTMLAEENIQHASDIVEAIETHLAKVIF